MDMLARWREIYRGVLTSTGHSDGSGGDSRLACANIATQILSLEIAKEEISEGFETVKREIG
jgi:hypothetical protein